MTKEELYGHLELLALEYRKTDVAPYNKIVDLAARWMDHGEFVDVPDAFNIWDNIMAELVVKYGLGRRLN